MKELVCLPLRSLAGIASLIITVSLKEMVYSWDLHLAMVLVIAIYAAHGQFFTLSLLVF